MYPPHTHLYDEALDVAWQFIPTLARLLLVIGALLLPAADLDLKHHLAKKSIASVIFSVLHVLHKLAVCTEYKGLQWWQLDWQLPQVAAAPQVQGRELGQLCQAVGQGCEP